MINVLPVEEIVLEFLLSDQIGGFAIELGEHADGASVGLLSPFPFAIELKSLDRSSYHSVFMILLLSSSRGISPSTEEGFGGIILDRVVCGLSNRLLSRILGRFTKAEICRAAAYLIKGVKLRAENDKTSLLVPRV